MRFIDFQVKGFVFDFWRFGCGRKTPNVKWATLFDFDSSRLLLFDVCVYAFACASLCVLSVQSIYIHLDLLLTSFPLFSVSEFLHFFSLDRCVRFNVSTLVKLCVVVIHLIFLPLLNNRTFASVASVFFIQRCASIKWYSKILSKQNKKKNTPKNRRFCYLYDVHATIEMHSFVGSRYVQTHAHTFEISEWIRWCQAIKKEQNTRMNRIEIDQNINE